MGFLPCTSGQLLATWNLFTFLFRNLILKWTKLNKLWRLHKVDQHWLGSIVLCLRCNTIFSAEVVIRWLSYIYIIILCSHDIFIEFLHSPSPQNWKNKKIHTRKKNGAARTKLRTSQTYSWVNELVPFG